MKTSAALMCLVACATMLAFAGTAPSEVDAQVDRVFANWNSPSTPGCAVGVAVNGQPVLAKAYGIADLEHDIRNTPETIFEAGSVSKQFTAASVLLLAREGKLSLDDPVRKYIPELPPPSPQNGFGAAGPPSPQNGFRAAGPPSPTNGLRAAS